MKKIAAVAVLSISVIVPGSFNKVFCEEKAPEQAQAPAAATFDVVRLVVGTGVENREPVGDAESFPASTEKVYCFLEAKVSEDTQAVFVWYFGGTETDKISLNLKKSPKWRTYTSKTIGGRKGDWKVDLQDAAGNVVKTVSFKVE